MPQYWLDLFTPRTWEESRQNEFKVSGFREARWGLAQKIKPGDYLICYMTEISRFCGIFKVVSKPYKDLEKAHAIWKGDDFPCLLNVKPVITLDFLHSIPAKEVIRHLSIVAKWSGIVRGSPNRIPLRDAKIIERILIASKNKNREYPLTKKISILSGNRTRRKTTYGEPFAFRGLRHAPINEQGVVYLFALVAKDLGFQVEAIGTSYPDCEAIRQIDDTGRWERVRIEFEYNSSSFKTHRHNPTECDIIVCWEHDWKQCPKEVIALKEVIKKLGA